MKTTFPLLFLAVSTFYCSAQTPVVYYNFDSNLKDQSSNGNHATNNGVSFTTDKNANKDSAIYVPGYKKNNGFLRIPEVLDGESEFTISIETRFKSFDTKYNEEAFISFGSLKTSGTGATGIYYRSYDKRLFFLLQTDNGNYGTYTSWNSSWNNSYKHFAMTYNKSTGTLAGYVDGVKVTERTGLSGDVKSYTTDAGLGAHWWGSGQASSFRIEADFDNVYVFTKALDSIDILKLYLRGGGKNKDSCLHYTAIYDTIQTKVYDTIVSKVYDTITNFIRIYDTIPVQVYDTSTVFDTIVETRYVTVEDTLLLDLIYVHNNVSSMSSIKMYPNPAKNELIVHANEYMKMSTIEMKLYNATNQLLYSSNIRNQETEIDISLYPRGVYYVHFIQGAKTLSIKKLIINR